MTAGGWAARPDVNRAVLTLGVVALRAGRKIEYDGANMRITNVPAANQYLQREARSGWSA